MARLIDADALKKQMCDECFGGYCGNSCYEWNLMNDAPTVDAVEVVRCKDCRFRYKDGANFCLLGTQSDDWFCANGERKEDANN